HIITIFPTRRSSDLLKNLGLKQISTRTAGYDVINVDLAHKNGLKVTNVPAYSPRSVAELALAHTMRLIRNLELFDERAEEQDFRRSEEHTSELQSRFDLVCRLLLEKKKHRAYAKQRVTRNLSSTSQMQD